MEHKPEDDAMIGITAGDPRATDEADNNSTHETTTGDTAGDPMVTEEADNDTIRVTAAVGALTIDDQEDEDVVEKENLVKQEEIETITLRLAAYANTTLEKMSKKERLATKTEAAKIFEEKKRSADLKKKWIARRAAIQKEAAEAKLKSKRLRPDTARPVGREIRNPRSRPIVEHTIHDEPPASVPNEVSPAQTAPAQVQDPASRRLYRSPAWRAPAELQVSPSGRLFRAPAQTAPTQLQVSASGRLSRAPAPRAPAPRAPAPRTPAPRTPAQTTPATQSTDQGNRTQDTPGTGVEKSLAAAQPKKEKKSVGARARDLTDAWAELSKVKCGSEEYNKVFNDNVRMVKKEDATEEQKEIAAANARKRKGDEMELELEKKRARKE